MQLVDLLLTGRERVFLAGAVGGVDLFVVFGRQTAHAAQRRDHVLRLDVVVAVHALADLEAVGRVDDHGVAGADIQTVGVKIIKLRGGAELHVADRHGGSGFFFHRNSL